MGVIWTRRPKSSLSDKLTAIARTSNTLFAVDFRDFAGKREFQSQWGPKLKGKVEGTAYIDNRGLVTDGSSGSRAFVDASSWGTGSASPIGGNGDWFIAVGFFKTASTDGGAIIKVSESSGINGYAVGLGGTSLDNAGNNVIGLVEGVAFHNTSTPVQDGYNTLITWHRALAPHGNLDTYWLNGSSSIYSASNTPANVASPYIGIGGYAEGANLRYWPGIIQWVIIGSTGRTNSLDTIITDAVLREFPPKSNHIYVPERRPLFFSTPSSSGSPYSIVADVGSYAVTGVDAAFKASRTLTAEAGSYALTGVAATLAYGHSLTAEAGSYSVTGVDATFQASRTIVAEAGSYVISGQDATFTYTPVGSGSPYSMDADAGSYTITGVDATFTASRTIVAEAGSYALTGVDASFTRSEYRLVAETGSYTISGVEATFSTTAAASSHGGGKTFGSNKKKKKQRKAIESEEWLKAEETAKQLLQDRFTKTTPEAKLEALATHIESLQPVIEALKALAREDVQEAVQETKTEELTEHQLVLNRFDALEKKIESVEELLIILMADL